MFDMTTYELLQCLYVGLTAGLVFGGAIIAWFLFQGEREHAIEHGA